MDSGEQDEPVTKPAASTDSETSDSDDEVRQLCHFQTSFILLITVPFVTRLIVFKGT